ncbi:MAG: carboxylesterase/lipase family protein [Sphingomonas sp.]|uniref:carboxylesterase/lipase family protein n=1 Tax=Sphingomonas sp. TaxID=28214 RepID=UPI003F7D40A1
MTRRTAIASSLVMGMGPALAGTAPVVETRTGRVRGAATNGVMAFKGIPYGRAGGRFLPSLPARQWTGVREATAFGPQAFQPQWTQADIDAFPAIPRAYRSVALPLLNQARSETPFTLNVWTRSVAKSAKAPVMVWLHGGGFSVGSSAAPCSDGAQLARHEGVVVVSLNHRLNIFGHLYLGHLGDDRYAASGNVGVLDIVLALRWVRDNIASFGGDPGNVTIFGVSGGGGKVAALFGMPVARSLFHKAIIQSGPYIEALAPEAAAETTNRVLATLGIRQDAIAMLGEIPAAQLYEAYDKVANASKNPGWLSDWNSWDRQFAPVRDGKTMIADPFSDAGRAIWADVPLLIGHTRDELYAPYDAVFDDAEAVRRLGMLGVAADRGRALLDELRRLQPTATMADHFYAIATRLLCTERVDRQTQLAAKRRGARTYAYLFAAGLSWNGGPRKALHSFDVPFCFDVVDAAPGELSPALDCAGRPLSTRMRGAWAAFARTGRPAHKDLPAWPAYDPAQPRRMVLDYICRVEAYDHTEDALIAGFLS